MLTPRARRNRRTASRGQVIVMFAISFTLFLAGAIAMVGDLATMYGASADAARAAQDAAIAGAADVDLPYFLNCSQPGFAPCTNGHGLQVINCGEQTTWTSSPGSGAPSVPALPPAPAPCAHPSLTAVTTPECASVAKLETSAYSSVAISCAFVPGTQQQQIVATVLIHVNLPVGFVSGDPVVQARYQAAAQAGTTSPIS